jgi:tyrosyl-tRNA synthetase
MSIILLKNHGLLKDCTNFEDLEKISNTQKFTFYFGIDLTADGLHVGHLSGLMMVRRLLKLGHRGIVLFGGATTKIGDPTGKDAERPIINQEQINKNKIGIKEDVLKILFGFEQSLEFVDNSDWLLDLNYIDMLNDVGRHFTLAKMLSLDSVKLRLEREQSISFTEFNYSIIQAYDFYYLAKTKNCIVQLGGSDQWGNITAGTELIRKTLNKEVFGLTIPLLTTQGGKKMGKTEGGAVWLKDTKLSDFDYFQYFRNTDDADVEKLLITFTDLDFDYIKKIASLKGGEINKAKQILAFEATKICRGEKSANFALQTANQVYLNQGEADQIKAQEILFNENETIIQILLKTGSVKSNSEAKTLIASGAVSIDDIKIEDIRFVPAKKISILRLGKKKVFKLVF